MIGNPGETKRKIIQTVTAVLYNCNLKGFLKGKIYKGSSKGLCVPGLNCYSCPGAVASCPLGGFQNALADSAFKPPLYTFGLLILFGIVLGRLICGFLCPFGLLQELVFKIPSPKPGKSGITRVCSLIKYLILMVFVILIPLTLMAPGFCKYICPAGTLEGAIPLIIADSNIRSMLGSLFFLKLAALSGILILCVFFYRGFCRFICPLGAIYSFFNPVSFFGVEVDREKCSGCSACVRFCRMDIVSPGDRECIQCGECKKVCPEGAIRFKNPLKRQGEISLKGRER